MSILYPKQPLIVNPDLAVVVGLNEAIIIQQIQYWTSDGRGHEHDGHLWVYNTIEQWQRQFPFWSSDTIKRAMTKLRNMNVLLATDRYNKMGMDKTLWYAINHEALENIGEEEVPLGQNAPLDRADSPLVQNAPSISADCPNPLVQIALSNNQRLPETTTETTEISCAKARKLTPQQQMVQAITDSFGLPCATEMGRIERGPIVAAASSIVQSGGTPDEVPARMAAYKKMWPTMTCSPMALAKHWHKLITATPKPQTAYVDPLEETRKMWSENNRRKRAEQKAQAALWESEQQPWAAN